MIFPNKIQFHWVHFIDLFERQTNSKSSYVTHRQSKCVHSRCHHQHHDHQNRRQTTALIEPPRHVDKILIDLAQNSKDRASAQN